MCESSFFCRIFPLLFPLLFRDNLNNTFDEINKAQKNITFKNEKIYMVG